MASVEVERFLKYGAGKCFICLKSLGENEGEFLDKRHVCTQCKVNALKTTSEKK